jgi:hypothetical protein
VNTTRTAPLRVPLIRAALFARDFFLIKENIETPFRRKDKKTAYTANERIVLEW